MRRQSIARTSHIFWLCCLCWLSFTNWSSSSTKNARDSYVLIPYAYALRVESTVVKEDETEGSRIQETIDETEAMPEKKRMVQETRNSETDFAPEKKPASLNQILRIGLGGGIPGALAGIIQVLTLMWLRTIINFQSRYGTSFGQALATLLREGGIPRLYQGLSFALIQAPLARFVSTAANDGVNALLASFVWSENWGAGRKTFVASIFVGSARMILMPIDTMKTVLQVDSAEGFRSLLRRVRAGRVDVLFEGSIATAVSAILGHYPWFYTYNILASSEWIEKLIPSTLVKNAGIGLIASIVSDTVVNAVRVIKTTKQSLASKQTVSYVDAIRIVLAADGWRGLFGRALRTRIFANALQSIVFTIIWRGLAERWTQKLAKED